MALVYVMALVTGKEDTKSELAKELSAVVPIVRQEEGCMRYDLHQSTEGKPEFMFYEIWQSDEALAAHSKAPHMNEMRERIKDLVAGPPKITTWRALEVA
jgi:quinol monooxygenase YgiN